MSLNIDHTSNQGPINQNSCLSMQDPASALPTEIFYMVLSHLDVPSYGKARRVSKEWHRIASDLNLRNNFIHEQATQELKPIIERFNFIKMFKGV